MPHDQFYAGVAPTQLTITLNQTGRYVAIKLTRTTPLHMAEVKVFGCTGGTVDPPGECNSGDPENLARNGVASQSSTYTSPNKEGYISIDTGSLSEGVYFLSADNGTERWVKSVIKNR